VLGHNLPIVDIEEIRRLAGEIGYPVLLKPAAGGGGRGCAWSPRPLNLSPPFSRRKMRPARHSRQPDIPGTVYQQPPPYRDTDHCDKHGNVVSLENGNARSSGATEGDRRGALPGGRQVTQVTHGRMACAWHGRRVFQRRDRGIHHGRPRNFFFMEMNNGFRWSIGHRDGHVPRLVELQLRVAAGEPCDYAEGRFGQGLAIEARICAEDSARNFLRPPD